MKNLKILLSVVLLVFLSVSFICCDFDESRNNLSGGVLLDDEKLSEIKNEILSGEPLETVSEGVTDEETAQPTESAPSTEKHTESDDIVYWTESGSVWHKSTSCSHLKNSKNILSGSVSDAEESGKTKPCSRCYD